MGVSCAFKVIEGTGTEIRFKPSEKTQKVLGYDEARIAALRAAKTLG